jgi:ribonuclease VapC
MIVDLTALLAILRDEPEAARFARLMVEAEVCRLSAVNRMELTMLLEARGGRDLPRRIDAFLAALSVTEEPVTLEQSRLARHAFYEFGRGRDEANLNFGDCFAYALAKAYDEPLLTKNRGFARTGVRRVAA